MRIIIINITMEIRWLLVIVAIVQFLVIGYNFLTSSTHCSNILYRGGLAASALTASTATALAFADVRNVGPYFLVALVGLGSAAGLIFAAARDKSGLSLQESLNAVKREFYVLAGALSVFLIAFIFSLSQQSGSSLSNKMSNEFRFGAAKRPPQITPRRRALYQVSDDLEAELGLSRRPVRRSAYTVAPEFYYATETPSVSRVVGDITRATQEVYTNLTTNPESVTQRLAKAARRNLGVLKSTPSAEEGEEGEEAFYDAPEAPEAEYFEASPISPPIPARRKPK